MKKRSVILAAVASMIASQASADLWSETPMSDIDLFLNGQLLEQDANLTVHKYSRISCDPAPFIQGTICSISAADGSMIFAESTKMSDPIERLIYSVSGGQAEQLFITMRLLIAGAAPDSDGEKHADILFDVIEALGRKQEIEIEEGQAVFRTANVDGLGYSLIIDKL